MSNEISHLKFGLSRLNPVIAGTFGAMTLTGAVAGGDQTWSNVGDMTFANGSILASGSTNGDTLLLKANDTTFLTLTTGATDTLDIGAHNISGDSTVTATKLLTFGAYGIAICDTYAQFGNATNAWGPKLKYLNSTSLAVRNAADSDYNDLYARVLYATIALNIADTRAITTAAADDDYFYIAAVDNDGAAGAYLEVGRVVSANDPYFAMGNNGTPEFLGKTACQPDAAFWRSDRSSSRSSSRHAA